MSGEKVAVFENVIPTMLPKLFTLFSSRRLTHSRQRSGRSEFGEAAAFLTGAPKLTAGKKKKSKRPQLKTTQI